MLYSIYMQKYGEYIFIGESGCPGFKIGSGSTPFFTISMIIFKDTLEIEHASVVLKKLRRKTFHNDVREFKYSDTRDNARLDFFEAINLFDFEYCVLVVNKKVLYSPELKNNKDSYYNYFIKSLLKYNSKYFNNANLKIDGSGNREFKRQFQSYLKKEVNKEFSFIKNIDFEDSKTNLIIQMADMIAGASRRFYQEGHVVSEQCLSKIENHKLNVWEFK